MKHQVKLINRLSRAITCFLFLALLSIGVGLGPSPAEAQPFAYITNFGDGTVSVINTANNSVTAVPLPVPAGASFNGPFGVAAHPAVSFVYITNVDSDSVSVINTANNAVTNVPLPTGSGPRGVAVHPTEPFVYVANASSNTVSVINTTDNSVTSVDVGSTPIGVAVAVRPAGTFVYVANQLSNTVSVINTTDNSVTSVDVGSTPNGVAVHPAGTFVYVANFGDGIVPGTVSVIDTADNSVTSVPLPVGSTPTGVAVHPLGSFIYVTNFGDGSAPGTVSVINTADTNDVTPVTVEYGPNGVSVHPAGTFVYVANTSSNSVSVINTATFAVTSVPVGVAPVAFGQFIGPGAVSDTSPFATLTAKAEIELGPLANDDEFKVKATFTLGAGSDGINPITEDVSFQVGTFSTPIPAGSFKLHPEKSGKKGKHVKPNKWTFEGVIDGVKLEAKITDLGGGSFEFKAEGKRADLTGTVNPVEVGLIIGDDSGSTTVTAEFN